MTKIVFAAAVAAAAFSAVPASATVHRVVRHHHMMMSNNGGHSRHTYYGVGSFGQTQRTTATGGNPGGYSNRN